jgi:micrococcal nuclease
MLVRPNSTTTPSLPTPQPTPSPSTATTARPAATPASVVSVIDGDTIRVRVAGRLETVRLIGIDAPETGSGRTVVECFNQQATDYLRSRLAGTAIELTTDPTQDLRDRYGRLLAYVWLADGALVNEAIVAGGYAHEYTYDMPYEYQGRIRRAEAAARAAGRGLWSPNACPATPPSAIGGPAPATLPAPTGAAGPPAPSVRSWDLAAPAVVEPGPGRRLRT